MVTAILKFEIRNTFVEWEQAFYSNQPIARPAGMFEIYHGHAPDDEKKVCVVLEPAQSARSRTYTQRRVHHRTLSSVRCLRLLGPEGLQHPTRSR